VQVVVVQTDPVWEDKPASQAQVRSLLARAAVPSGALVVLPEMFDTGFSMNVAATAQTPSLESEAFLRELARDYDAAVLGGVVGPIRDGQASNEAVAWAPDGTQLTRYRKMQPFTLTGEDVHYGAGNAQCVFEWSGMKISPFICYDLRFPETIRPAARAGAELIVVIACWPEARSEHWVRLLQARAIENQSFVVGVNRCGRDPLTRYNGRSTAFDPLGKQLFEGSDRPQVETIDLDPEQARQWRAKFPALRDIRATGRT
jgi:predicted amidohydrolase